MTTRVCRSDLTKARRPVQRGLRVRGEKTSREEEKKWKRHVPGLVDASMRYCMQYILYTTPTTLVVLHDSSFIMPL